MTGFLSKPASNSGRNSSDRQYLFINGRPCDLPKVMKLSSFSFYFFSPYISFSFGTSLFHFLNICIFLFKKIQCCIISFFFGRLLNQLMKLIVPLILINIPLWFLILTLLEVSYFNMVIFFFKKNFSKKKKENLSFFTWFKCSINY